MSSATPSSFSIPRPSSLPGVFARTVQRLVTGIKAVTFWSAALLPLVLVGALAAGIGTQRPNLFTALLAVNVVCAVVGHGYSPER
jgi:hypothetical protein